jgi:hypothetical protein
MAIARTMMLHMAIHWPDHVANPTLTPLAVKHAVFLVNHMPDPRTGLSPSDVFIKADGTNKGKLTDFHVWECPVYVLDKNPTLWPLAVKHAVFLVNPMPDPRTGLSPSDVFIKTRWEQRKLTDVHVWRCPVYVLDKMISEGKRLQRWTPRSTRTVNLGFSDKYASSAPLVLNTQTGYITPQFHIVFDNWFAAVPALPITCPTSMLIFGSE